MRDFGSSGRLEQIRGAAVEDAREALRVYVKANKLDMDVDAMDAEEVMDAVADAGLVERDALEREYNERHPEVDPANTEQPKGLETPTAEASSTLDLYLDRVDAQVLAESGLDPDSPLDPATQAEHALASNYARERGMAVDLVAGRTDVGDPDDLTDEQLGSLVEEEATKELMGEGDNPLPLETVLAHRRADQIGKLTNEHGVPREEVDDLPLDELMNRLHEERSQAAKNAAPADVAEVAVPPNGIVEPDEPAGGGQPAVGQNGGGETAAGETGGSETVAIVFTTQAGGDVHRSADGRWFDGNGNQIVDVDQVADLDATYRDFLDEAAVEGAPTGHDGTIDTLQTTGRTADEAPNVDGDDGTGDDSDAEDSDDDSDDDSADGDDDDDDGADDETSTDPASDGEGNDDDDSDGEAGGDEGTPTIDGDVPIDPEDQARFDDTSFGIGQRQDQIDAIDADRSAVGGPVDDPSAGDVADFFASPAGAEAAETLADGVEHRADGGDSDPDDLEAEESNADVIDGKLDGDGLADPPEDGGATPGFGAGSGRDPFGGPPVVTGPQVGDRLDDAGGPEDPTDPEGLVGYEAVPLEELDVAADVDLHAVALDVHEAGPVELDADLDLEG